MKTYAAPQALKNEQGTAPSNPYFGSVVGVLYGSAVAVSADGHSIFNLSTVSDGNPAAYARLFGPALVTIDADTNLLTDVTRVCEVPQLLGVEPFGPGQQGALVPTATGSTDNGQKMAQGPEAVAKESPDRVVAMIDGNPLTAKHGTCSIG